METLREDTVEYVNEQARGVEWYRSNFKDRLNARCSLPFRVSPEPFHLPLELKERLPEYGKALASYYRQCDELLRALPNDHRWSKWLKRAPEWMQGSGRHFFIRPDFILTEDHPVVTEIETSPFGLGLAHFLSASYRKAGKDTLGGRITDALPHGLTFGYTPNTDRYMGQLNYLASATEGRAVPMKETNGEKIYRCFYLYEAMKEPSLLDHDLLPPARPDLEEKALMGLLWDGEFKFDYEDTLKKIIPKTYVLNGPCPFGKWEDLSKMSRGQRNFVLKTSGFSPASSWARGVTFLNKLSQKDCEETMQKAMSDTENLYVIQEFRKGKEFTQSWFDYGSNMLKEAKGRVRLTPYFSVETGEMLECKSTLCEATDFVHAGVDSVNSPVS